MGTTSPAQEDTPQQDVVILIHGLGSHPILLSLIERFLARRGFQTRNWSYLSILGSIETHAARLGEELNQLQGQSNVGRVHLVTHSMGSIVARHLLAESRPEKLGRMVMLGPPNRGSHVASALSPMLGLVCKPLSQLADTPGSFVCELATDCPTEVGIIAAAYDRVVPLANTYLPGQTDHVIVPSGHTRMLLRPDVAELVATFLEKGSFQSPEVIESRPETLWAGLDLLRIHFGRSLMRPKNLQRFGVVGNLFVGRNLA